jgi:cell division protein FtsZ
VTNGAPGNGFGPAPAHQGADTPEPPGPVAPGPEPGLADPAGPGAVTGHDDPAGEMNGQGGGHAEPGAQAGQDAAGTGYHHTPGRLDPMTAARVFDSASTRRRPVVFEEDDDLDVPDFLK